jgi:hypothetical protein
MPWKEQDMRAKKSRAYESNSTLVLSTVTASFQLITTYPERVHVLLGGGGADQDIVSALLPAALCLLRGEHQLSRHCAAATASTPAEGALSGMGLLVAPYSCG